jgi:hypothetical protein
LFPDIVPPKGAIKKNIHILFDQSGSMGAEKHAMALRQVSMMLSQSFDEFNVKVTVFGETSETLVPLEANGFDLSEEHEGWMSFPSARNVDKIIEWLAVKRVGENATMVHSPFKEAVSESIDDLSITIVSDCMFDDANELLSLIDKTEVPPVLFSVIPITSIYHMESVVGEMYKDVKQRGLYWINVRENGR